MIVFQDPMGTIYLCLLQDSAEIAGRGAGWPQAGAAAADRRADAARAGLVGSIHSFKADHACLWSGVKHCVNIDAKHP